jgi:hypothetical protein
MTSGLRTVSEIVADLRDDLADTLAKHGITGDRNADISDDLIRAIGRWCAKEPVNDND